MVSKQNKALEEAMKLRRRPAVIEDQMSGSMFGEMAAQVRETIMVSVGQIYVSQFQSRINPDEEVPEDDDRIKDLVASIEQDGLLNPILLRELPPIYELDAVRLVDLAEEIEGNVSNPTDRADGVVWRPSIVTDGPRYELIAGEGRVRAHLLLKRSTIPAKILKLTDAQAARALTVDNLVHRPLSDYELYLHIKMLRRTGAANTQKELALVLGCSRIKVTHLECFAKVPARVSEILSRKPGLLGANQIYELSRSGHLETNPEAVVEAVERVAEKKINQTGMIGYIQRRVKETVPQEKREYQLTVGNARMKVVSKGTETKITGDVDVDALREILQRHLETILKRDNEC